MPPKPKPPEELFWPRVTKGDGCWEWQGYCDKAGYGHMGVSIPARKVVATHRLAWELAHGAIPNGLHVCHHCDNPPCVKTEPDERYPEGHLFLGTDADNLRDMTLKGRARRQELGSTRSNYRGTLTPMAKISEDDVVVIRGLRQEGLTYKAIGDRYGLDFTTVYRICKRRSWKHVP